MKKKTALVIAVSLLVTAVCSAKFIGGRFKVTQSEEEFDVMYYVTEDMKQIKNLENRDVAITQSFKVERNKLKGELRYSLFTDVGDTEDEDNLKIEYATWVMVCLLNIAGYDLSPGSISRFNDSDVKAEFNGDFGCTAFIKNPKSDYGKGYKYMMVDFFYKKGQGLVMRVFLFNDMKFSGMDGKGGISMESPLFVNYHSFKFMEKDKDGKYITE